jgi:hypothetical protein
MGSLASKLEDLVTRMNRRLVITSIQDGFRRPVDPKEYAVASRLLKKERLMC